MALQVSTTHRRLNVKMKIAGFEAFDLIGTLIATALLNLFFGQTGVGTALAFALPLAGLVLLYFSK
ncbi:MAG: hypothetical protein OXB88_10135, partial [Bacteriovoracales bacterium]|nr:hypothetical protein [Bacteriovoracales bacterium]